ncbi:MAG: hypothetical protein N3B18_05860 [Desulfobacterota bacterium]|nr:hypothetical protein [Thermodesulfobacteriota bacterium]
MATRQHYKRKAFLVVIMLFGITFCCNSGFCAEDNDENTLSLCPFFWPPTPLFIGGNLTYTYTKTLTEKGSSGSRNFKYVETFQANNLRLMLKNPFSYPITYRVVGGSWQATLKVTDSGKDSSGCTFNDTEEGSAQGSFSFADASDPDLSSNELCIYFQDDYFELSIRTKDMPTKYTDYDSCGDPPTSTGTATHVYSTGVITGTCTIAPCRPFAISLTQRGTGSVEGETWESGGSLGRIGR